MSIHQALVEPWRVTLIDTGEATMIGGRIKRILPFIGEEAAFCLTYGDGVGDIDISKAIALHRDQRRLATVTATQPPGRFGSLRLEGNRVTGFQEKPIGDGGWINGGFFVLSPQVGDYIDGDSSVWEREPMERLAADEVNPLTAYACSKVATERGLAGMNAGGITITCLRFGTACGMSDRLRLDLVLNDFVACAITTGEISVLSDGTPWRPLIDVSDMARAIEWAIGRDPSAGGEILSVNAGSDAGNYQVKDLAEAVATAVPGTRVSINRQAPPDKRSYRVDFSLFQRLAPEHQPRASRSVTALAA